MEDEIKIIKSFFRFMKENGCNISKFIDYTNNSMPKALTDIYHYESEVDNRINLYGHVCLLNKHGKIVNNTWYNDIWHPQYGLYMVNRENKFNFMRKSGRFISDIWFDDIYSFSGGFARISLNHKWNFIDKQGKTLLNTWYDKLDPFRYSHAFIYDNEKGMNYINKKGEIVGKWYKADGWI
jgi:hypothetical protein